MKFSCYGHANVLATHAKTLEFTKDAELSLRGDCILGVRADFSLNDLKEVLQFSRIHVLMRVEGHEDSFECSVNNGFCDDEEMVFRLGDFCSSRTLGIRATKAAKDIDRKIIECMKNDVCMEIEIRGIE